MELLLRACIKGYLVFSILFSSTIILAEEAIKSPSPKPGFQWSEIDKIAVLNRGRLKPFHTYARETALFVTGELNWHGFAPEELILSLLTSFNEWADTQFIRIDYRPLKEKLGLQVDSKHFSYNQLKSLTKIGEIVRDGMEKERSHEKMSDLERKAVVVQNQLAVLEGISRGDELTVLPNPEGLPVDNQRTWFSLPGLFDPMPVLPYTLDEKNKLSEALGRVLNSYIKGDSSDFNSTAPHLISVLKEVSHGHYPTDGSITREIIYNKSRPFRWTWVIYTAAFILLLGFIVTQRVGFKYSGLILLGAGYLMHAYGFVLRSLIAGRPPVTNMYESVIWVTFGCITFSWLVWIRYKNIVIPMAASVFAIVGLAMADNLPNVLDPSIQTLTAVLRSNFWLTIHVLTITLGYAAFALSLCLGNVVMGNYLFRPKDTSRIQSLTLYMYRSVQIGVVFLASGTILGGVWADYSWGRFWGWDPKEVWALIALLLYLAVLHGRFAGWLKGFGFTASTLLCFLGVLMAWYGVNFVLGAGLHSYGFGSGGYGYVAWYILLQVSLILLAYTKYSKTKKEALNKGIKNS